MQLHGSLSILDFPGGSDGKASACNTGDTGLIPGLGRSPGEGKGNPFQYSCLATSLSSLAAKHKDDSVSHTWV